MNREQKRAMIKNLKKNGLTKESAETFMMRMENNTGNPVTAWEGKKVMLDYYRITSYPDWPQMRADYREWVEAHKNEIFTVEYNSSTAEEDKKKGESSFVQFVEDSTNPKWLWWAGDLVPLSNLVKPKTELELKKEQNDARIEEIISKLK